jgi:hypothetical protein
MAKIVKELVTKWTYRVDTTQITKARKSVMDLKKSFKEVRQSSIDFSKGEFARIRRIRGAWQNLNSEVQRYRNKASGAAGMGGTRGGGAAGGRGGKKKGKRGRGGGVSGPSPFAFVGGQVVGSGLATSLFHAGSAAPMLAAGAAAAVGVLKSIQLAGKRQEYEMVLGAMLKSDEAAKNLLDTLNEFGEKTPFQISQLRELSKLMLATGFGVNELIPTLRIMGNVTQGNNVILSRMIVNLGQIRGRGFIDTRDLNQFHVAGIALGEAIAKFKNISRGEVSKLVTQRAISFTDVMNALKSMQEGGGKFTGFLDKIQASLSGAIGQLQDSWEVFGETVGAGFLPIADKSIRGVSFALKGLTKFLRDVGTVLGTVFNPVFGALIKMYEQFFSKSGLFENKWFRLFTPLLFLVDLFEDVANFIRGKDSILGEIVKWFENLDFAAMFGKMVDSIKIKAKELESLPGFTLMGKLLDLVPNFIGASVVPPGTGNSLASNATFNQNVQVGLERGVSTNEALKTMNSSGNTLLDSLNHRLQPTSYA